MVETVREVILQNLSDGYEEAMNWGMISYQVPLSRYPDTYNKQPLLYAALAAQKNHFAVYLTTVYSDPEKEQYLKKEYEKRGLKPDMGKSCLRFKSLDQIAFDVVGKIISETSVDEFIRIVEDVMDRRKKARDKKKKADHPSS
ncbi:MAG: DUF1801 domain-containing protein [Calditrichia bacterium]